MFPSAPTLRPNKRSLRELMRSAVDTAVEFATLGEVESREPVVVGEHPHRRTASAQARARRPGAVRPRPGVCVAAKR